MGSPGCYACVSLSSWWPDTGNVEVCQRDCSHENEFTLSRNRTGGGGIAGFSNRVETDQSTLSVLKSAFTAPPRVGDRFIGIDQSGELAYRASVIQPDGERYKITLAHVSS
jgi:hypothetical protein